MIIKISADRLEFRYDPEAVALVKQIPGLRWAPDERAWIGRDHAVSAGAKAMAQALGARVRLQATSRRPRAGGKGPVATSAGMAGPLPEDGQEANWQTEELLALAPGLRRYQVEGVAWCVETLKRRGGALLADDMGLGKTVQALVCARALGASRLLVVCPAMALGQWLRLARVWAPELELVAMSYEKFSRVKAEDFGPGDFGLFVLDEAHYCANPKAGRTKAVVSWRMARETVPLLCLTGTPVATRPRDLWQILDLLEPGAWGKKWLFEKRYCAGYQREINSELAVWDASGRSNEEELAERLSYLMLRRLKRDVASELPQMTRMLHEIKLKPKDKSQLRKVEGQRTASSRTEELSSRLGAIEEFKLSAAADLVSDIIASGGRPLILTLRRETAYALGRALGAPVVTGETEAAHRAQRLSGGQGAGVATLFSVTVGIDLVQFDHVVFVGLDWVPSRILQAEARLHRIGQRGVVTAHYLIALGTADEHIREVVIDRLDLLEGLGLGGSGLERELEEQDLLENLLQRIRGEAA